MNLQRTLVYCGAKDRIRTVSNHPPFCSSVPGHSHRLFFWANWEHERLMHPGSRTQPRGKPKGNVAQIADMFNNKAPQTDVTKEPRRPPQRPQKPTNKNKDMVEGGPGKHGDPLDPRTVREPVKSFIEGVQPNERGAEPTNLPDQALDPETVKETLNAKRLAAQLNKFFEEKKTTSTVQEHRGLQPVQMQPARSHQPDQPTLPHIKEINTTVRPNPRAKPDLPGIEAGGATRTKLAIFHWEAMADISWAAGHLVGHHFDELVRMSITTDPGWSAEIETATLIIFYHSKQSGKTEQDSQSFLYNCMRTNESQEFRSEHSAKRPIAVLSRSADGGRWWKTLQRMNSGMRWMIRHIDISRIDEWRIRGELAECSYAIWHFTKERIADLRLVFLCEMKRVLVLIDDLEDCRPGTRSEDGIYENVKTTNAGNEKTRESKRTKERNGVRKPKFLGTVGIFSRSSRKDYEWLETLLRSAAFGSQVKDVRSFVISNNGFRQFTEEVSRCSAGILYHTKNRGGLNITDVTSSLYDEELKYLASRLGKDNVFVLIDDLEDADGEEKTKILETQPSIVRFASDLLLITSREKTNNEGLLKKLCFNDDKEENRPLTAPRPKSVSDSNYIIPF
ncbi:uncharacterized protein LOC128501151 [Spea bombifrons]|uniref:uncharacterized protein LOC128501151 n=1 Tax=Spea bombifrons TaxID=233779 RepID=UPI00234A2987|nr:uncharacterized protein LOC128501151 [Spea bombifrons]